jgi:AcrR family transcriptional regulator
MPAPARTSTEEVVAAGRRILERDGLEALTMQAIADAVGVRPPSLYKRVEGREGLVRLIADSGAAELAEALDEVVDGPDAATDLRALAVVFRAFAHRNPATYPLLFAPRLGGVSAAWRDRSADAVRRIAGRLAGPEHELAAARTVVAWANGFVTMELAGAFQLGGDVEEAWDYGLDALVGALAG